MQLESVTIDSFWFDTVKEIYEYSFPPEERRELDSSLFGKSNYALLAAVEDEVIGFLSTWEFDNFDFIEHFAVRKELRSQGVGTKLLAEFMNNRKNIIIEVERPKSEEQYMRIKFYERMGFKLNTYDYVQPSYGPGKPPVNMHLMSYPKALSIGEYNIVKKQLYAEVYGLGS
jgi:ribosomal protein S18 acetylase RimI-like enzyme